MRTFTCYASRVPQDRVKRKRWTSVDPLEGDPDEALIKKPFERALIRNLRMLNRHLWELRGDLSMVAEQIATERAEAARIKEKR